MDRFDITKQFVVIDPVKNASPVDFTPDLFERLDTDFDGFKDCELISAFEFDTDWPTWEVHPHGDEIVMLLSGEVTFILDLDGKHESLQLTETGQYLFVPKGIWHTAKIAVPSKLLFITPGQDTKTKPC